MLSDESAGATLGAVACTHTTLASSSVINDVSTLSAGKKATIQPLNSAVLEQLIYELEGTTVHAATPRVMTAEETSAMLRRCIESVITVLTILTPPFVAKTKCY